MTGDRLPIDMETPPNGWKNFAEDRRPQRPGVMGKRSRSHPRGGIFRGRAQYALPADPGDRRPKFTLTDVESFAELAEVAAESVAPAMCRSNGLISPTGWHPPHRDRFNSTGNDLSG